MENPEKLNLTLNFSKFVISSKKSQLILENLNIKIIGLDNYVFYLQNEGTLTILVTNYLFHIFRNKFIRNVQFF